MPHDTGSAQTALIEAHALLAAADEALVAHFVAHPEGGVDGRTRHLQAEVDGARRRVGLAQARVTALERLTLAEAQQAETAAQAEIDTADRQYRAQCREVLDERRQAAAAALTDYLIAEIGSGTVSPAFSREARGWVGQLERAVGFNPAEVALMHVRHRSLGA